MNNAGKLTVGMVEWQPLDSFKNIADVNLWGMISVTQTFLPLVKKARGRVINMGSILGEIQLTVVRTELMTYPLLIYFSCRIFYQVTYL